MIRKWQIAKPYTHIKITCITKQVQNAVDSQNLSATDAGLDQQSNQKKILHYYHHAKHQLSS